MPVGLNTVVSFRTTRAERHLFEALAAQQDMLLAHFIRDVLLAKARQKLGDWALGQSKTADARSRVGDVVGDHPP